MSNEHSNEHSETTTIIIDNEEQKVPKHDLSAAELLRLIGKDPALVYLVQVEGRHQDSFENNPDGKPNIHHGATFVTASLAPTPVS